MTTEIIMEWLKEAGTNGGAGLLTGLAAVKLFVSAKLKAANAGVLEAKALVTSTKADAEAELAKVKAINTETTLAANEREIARLDLALENKFISPEARELYEKQKAEVLAQMTALKASKVAVTNAVTNTVEEVKTEVVDTIKNITTGWL